MMEAADPPTPMPNSDAAIRRRIALGTISLSGPLLLTTARSALLVVVQALMALGFWLGHNPSPWRAQAPWWSVYATLVDVGCLFLLRRQARREGIRLRDLFEIDNSRLGREVLWGFGLLLLLFPAIQAGTILASWLVYGSFQPDFAQLAPGLLVARRLPAWAVAYSLSLFWLVWSPTEEVIYQAYCAARLEALTRNKWLTVSVVGFWWAFQHSLFPLVLDPRLVLWRFLQFAPFVVVVQLIYLRVRRLPRFIVMHWPMDLLAARMTLAL